MKWTRSHIVTALYSLCCYKYTPRDCELTNSLEQLHVVSSIFWGLCFIERRALQGLIFPKCLFWKLILPFINLMDPQHCSWVGTI